MLSGWGVVPAHDGRTRSFSAVLSSGDIRWLSGTLPELDKSTSRPLLLHISRAGRQHLAGLGPGVVPDPHCWLVLRRRGRGNCCQRGQILTGGTVVSHYHHPVSDRNSMFSCTPSPPSSTSMSAVVLLSI